MKPPKAHIEKLAHEPESLNMPIDNLYLDVEKKRLIATNGIALIIRHDVETHEHDKSGLIDPDAIRYTREKMGANLIACEKEQFVRYDARGSDSVAVMKRPQAAHKQFPIADIDKFLAKDYCEQPVMILNFEVLKQLVDAMRRERDEEVEREDMHLAFFVTKSEKDAVVVVPGDCESSFSEVDDKCVALIMQITRDKLDFPTMTEVRKRAGVTLG